MLEKDFQRKVIKYLESKGAYVINYNPTAVGKGGAADLLVSINGIFVAMELKVNHQLQQRQALNLKKVNESGGVGIVLFEGKDWKEMIDKLFNDSYFGEWYENNDPLVYSKPLYKHEVEQMRMNTHIIPEAFLEKVNWDE